MRPYSGEGALNGGAGCGFGSQRPLIAAGVFSMHLIPRAHTGAGNIGALENATVCRLTFAQSCAPIIQNATVKRGFWGATFRKIHPA